MKVIKLGRKSDSAPILAEAPGVHYPSFYVDGVPGLEDVPDEGTMTIRYKVCNRTTSEKPGEKPTTCLSIDVIAIEKIDGEEVDLDADTGDALDKIAASVAAKLKKDY